MSNEDDYVVNEKKSDKPIGYPPNPIIKKNLEKLYISITGSLDVGDFTTYLKEISDLTYIEAKNKLLATYGSPKQLSEAKLRAKTRDAEEKLAHYEQQAANEQRTLEQEFSELDEIARQRLDENLNLIRKNEELQKEIQRLKAEIEKTKEIQPVIPTPTPLQPKAIEIKAVPQPTPEPIPTPTQPPETPPSPPPTIPPTHGSLYEQFKIKVNFARTVTELNKISADVFDILAKDETEKLTDADISELRQDLKQAFESVERRSAERAARPAPKITRVGPPRAAAKPTPAQAGPIREELGQFLFDFNQVPGRDTDRFIELMKSKYKINWLRSDYIKKLNPTEISAASPDRTNFLTFEYYKDRFTGILRYDTKAVEFWAVQEDSHINIFTKRRVSAVISRLRPPTEAGIGAEVPQAPAAPPPQKSRVAYRYRDSEISMLNYKGEEYMIDYELVRVITRNKLLPDPPFNLKWMELPPELKRTLTGYDIATAFRIQVNYRHYFSWYELINDYGIPEKYILAWGGTLE